MVDTFEFETGGRRFSCCIEARRAAPSEAWWWFGVSGDRHRYAPFRATTDDTPNSVQSRIMAYYGDVLERRGLPATRPVS